VRKPARRSVRLLALLLAAGAMLPAACRSTGSSARAPEAPAAARPAPPAPLTPEQHAANVASFDQVWQTVRDRHWDPEKVGPAWDQARDELRPRVLAARSTPEAREVMRELLARLDQSHFGIIPAEAYAADADAAPAKAPATASTWTAPVNAARPASTDSPAPATAAPASVSHDGSTGLTIRILSGQPVITRVEPGSPAASANLRAGYVIESIRGTPVGPALEAVASSLAPGSPAALAAQARTVEALLSGPVGSSLAVAYRDATDQPRRADLTLAPPTGTPAKFGNLPTFYYTFESRLIEPDVGYIAFSIFLNPPDIMPRFAAAVDSFRSSRGLIIDLRGNVGGLGAMAMGIGNHFVTERNLRLGTMHTRGAKLNFFLNPQPQPFTQPVAILIDELSLSTSEILAGGLQSIGRARVFGSPSGGAALPSAVERLPNGDRFQFAFADYLDASGQRLEGRGVIPDQPTPLTREALLKGQDPALDAALAWIRTHAGS
jgi:carboxyl-terminal processing protease